MASESQIHDIGFLWKSDADISIVMSHFNICICPLKCMDLWLSPYIPLMLNFVIS